MMKLPVSLLFIQCCYHAILMSNAFFFNSLISVTTEKYWYPVGESVKIYCKTTNGISSELFFKDLVSNIPLNQTDENYSIKVVNTSSILLQFHNISVGEYNYICQNAETEKSLSNIGVISFKVGYPPEIKTIQFESVDLKQLSLFMTPKLNGLADYWKTTWKLGENISEESVSDEYLHLNESESYVCEDAFNCTISGERYFNPNRTYQFTILGSNHFGLFNKTYLISPTLKIVKLKELKIFEVFVGDTSISLSWTWQMQDLWPSDVIKCKVSSEPQNGQRKNYFTVCNDWTFKDLVPDTRYTLDFQCKFESSGFWSDVTSVHKKTLSSGVIINHENLKIIDVTDTDVIISWKSPPLDSNILHYLVIYKADNNPKETTVISPSPEFHLKNLKSSTHYTVSVALCSSNGCTRKKSSIKFKTKNTRNFCVRPDHTLQPRPDHTLQPRPDRILQPRPDRTLQPRPDRTLQPQPDRILQPKMTTLSNQLLHEN